MNSLTEIERILCKLYPGFIPRREAFDKIRYPTGVSILPGGDATLNDFTIDRWGLFAGFGQGITDDPDDLGWDNVAWNLTINGKPVSEDYSTFTGRKGKGNLADLCILAVPLVKNATVLMTAHNGSGAITYKVGSRIFGYRLPDRFDPKLLETI